MRKISSIIIHCSDSGWGCQQWINLWHQQRGWGNPHSGYQVSTGYHYIILNGKAHPKSSYQEFLDGALEIGRPLDSNLEMDLGEEGAHALGYNQNSIGICLIGKKSFTQKQFLTLWRVILGCIRDYEIPVENILGHYETAQAKISGKTCPNFQVAFIRVGLREFFKI